MPAAWLSYGCCMAVLRILLYIYYVKKPFFQKRKIAAGLGGEISAPSL
jgi:hypothetical protein